MSDPNHATQLHFVALGSSFAAGPGIKPILDRRAGRSANNYAHLLAASYGARLTDLSVSGATTATILDTEQVMRRKRFPPQIDGMPADADIVTITAGGNDLSYVGSVMTAAWAGWLSKRPLIRILGRRFAKDAIPEIGADDLQRASDGLSRIVDAVRLRAPHVRVLLVDYLTLLGPDTKPAADAPFDAATIAEFRHLGAQLNAVFAAAAERSGAELVPISATSESHAIGSAEPWVLGFRPSFRGPTPFHPNAAGMAAVARTIREHLEAIGLSR